MPDQSQNNDNIVQFDVDENVWKQMPVQQQMLFVIHNLINFSTTPAYSIFEGFRMQVKQTGIIMPVHVPFAIGKQPVGVRLGRI